MKKFMAMILFLTVSTMSYATLTNTTIPVTKNGASNPPTLQNGSITDTGTSSGPGNVGIGSPNPGQALDVMGTVRASNFIGSGAGLSGITSSANFFTDSVTTGHIDYVGCGDSIATVYAAATAGDTIQLGKCTYTLTSAVSGSKSVHIKGMGKYETIVTSAGNATGIFSFTAPVSISDMTILGTNLNVSPITVRLCGGACDQSVSTGAGATSDANYFKNLYINVSSPTTAIEGIQVMDGGYTIDDCFVEVSYTGIYAANAQNYAVQEDNDASTTADTHSYIRNSILFNNSGDTVGGNTGTIVRGIRFYNWQNMYNTFNMYLYVDSSTIKVYDNAATMNGTEACHNQGQRITSYYYNSTCDGDVLIGPNNYNQREDIRCDDGASCTLNNTVLTGSIYQDNLGTGIVRIGGFNGQTLTLTQAPTNGATTNGVNANPLISAIGGTGGGGYTGAGGVGANVAITGGRGGYQIQGVTTNTGGIGGGIALTGGTGGLIGLGTTSTNVGGAGGNLTFTAGTGGVPSGSTIANNGGAGGNLSLISGIGGVGIGTSATTGAKGNIYIGTGNIFLGVLSSGAPSGAIEIGTTDATNRVQELNVLGGTSLNGNVGIGTSSPLSSLMIGTIPTTANEFVAQGGWSATGIQSASSIATLGNFVASNHSSGALASTVSLGGLSFSGSNQAGGMVQSGGIFGLTDSAWGTTSAPTDLRFFTTPINSVTRTEVMRLNSDGNLGIGTTIVPRALTIVVNAATQGGIRLTNLASGGRSFDLLSDAASSSVGVDGLSLYDSTAATPRLFLDQNGNFGIGSITPGQILDVQGTVRSLGYTQTGTSSDTFTGTTTFSNATNSALFTGGNVGVGSATPGQTLDVQGTIRFSNSLLNTKSSTGIGWSEHNATNQACNTTCGTSACVIGLDIGTVGVVNSGFVACTDATADDCICAGP